MSSRKGVVFQDFLNYNEFVDVLRFPGRSGRQSDKGVARPPAREGPREDQCPNLVHAGRARVARAVRERSQGLARTGRTQDRVCWKSVPATGILRTTKASIHHRARSNRKRTFAEPGAGGGR